MFAILHKPSGKICEVENGVCYEAYATRAAALAAIAEVVAADPANYEVVTMPADLAPFVEAAPVAPVLQTKKISELKAGEFFKRKPGAAKVYIRGEYVREIKKYSCDDCGDVWGDGLQLKGNTIVFIGFTY